MSGEPQAMRVVSAAYMIRIAVRDQEHPVPVSHMAHHMTYGRGRAVRL